MLIKDVRLLRTGERADISWIGLRRYLNADFVTDQICSLHNLNGKYKKFAQKQAEQIRFCIIQAKEYYDASKVVGLATKPLLMYYSAMSLASSELLLKQSGESSLDFARREHAHHGLELSINPNHKPLSTTEAGAETLVAKPMIGASDSRRGTFALWHRSSRELPVVARSRIEHGVNAEITIRPVIFGIDISPTPISLRGITLLDCMKNMPGLDRFLSDFGLENNLVRSSITESVFGHFRKLSIVIHPDTIKKLDDVYSNFYFGPSETEYVKITEYHRGLLIEIIGHNDLPSNLVIPPSRSDSSNDTYFLCERLELNEFGTLYVALYLAGMYARYYPDFWMKAVEKSSFIALAVEEIMRIADERLAGLCLNEMSRQVYIREDLKGD